MSPCTHLASKDRMDVEWTKEAVEVGLGQRKSLEPYLEDLDAQLEEGEHESESELDDVLEVECAVEEQ